MADRLAEIDSFIARPADRDPAEAVVDARLRAARAELVDRSSALGPRICYTLFPSFRLTKAQRVAELP